MLSRLADIYIIHPDGSALRKLTNQRQFLRGAAMDPRQQLHHRLLSVGRRNVRISLGLESSDEALRRMGRAPLRGNTTLVSIDVATGEQTTVAAPPGIKFFLAALSDGEIAYVKKDGDDRGIAYRSTGKKGPLGLVRSPSWSPDGTSVVYHRFVGQGVPAWQKTWSRNPGYDLVTTNSLPAFDPSGTRLVATSLNTTSRPNRAWAERGATPVPAGREACAIGRLVSAW